MKISGLLLIALTLVGCGHYRTEAEEVAMSNAAATAWESAQAILIARDPREPAEAIKRLMEALCSALGHPYPPVPQPQLLEKPR